MFPSIFLRVTESLQVRCVLTTLSGETDRYDEKLVNMPGGKLCVRKDVATRKQESTGKIEFYNLLSKFRNTFHSHKLVRE